MKDGTFSFKACWWSLLGMIATIIAAAVFSGCKSKAVLEKETKDSVRVEYREKVVKVPVTVYVEVPVEVKEKFSNDSTSHLETSFAVSDAAMVWIDGVAFLRHSLENKAQKIEKKDSVQVVEKYKYITQTKYNTVNKTKLVEKKLSWWQETLMTMGWLALAVVAILVFLWIGKLKDKLTI